MRIGVYGLPCSGKTTLIESVPFLDRKAGSKLLHQLDPSFSARTEDEKNELRSQLARSLMLQDNFLMDGHWSFNDKVVFTPEDGQLYDTFLYIYVRPDILRDRIMASPRNRQYLLSVPESSQEQYLENWQRQEIAGLRAFCHEADKNLYVLDDPQTGYVQDKKQEHSFLQEILGGYDCKAFAQDCTDSILSRTNSPTLFLCDGDRTFAEPDMTEKVYGLSRASHIYDWNFYTGYQQWRHARLLSDRGDGQGNRAAEGVASFVPNQRTFSFLAQNPDFREHTFILSSGAPELWRLIGEQEGILTFSGSRMSADTKFFVTKYLRRAGRRVIALGDSLGDWWMLKEADRGILAEKDPIRHTGSASLAGYDLSGLERI